MKRVAKTRLKICQNRVKEERKPQELELPSMPRKQQDLPTISRKEQQQNQIMEEQKITKPDLLVKVLIIDSKESRNLLLNATANDVKNVERLVVKGQMPEDFEENFELKRKFAQDPGLLYRDDDNDKDANKIRMVFEYFWQYVMKLRLFDPGTTLEIEDCFIRPDKHLEGSQFDTLIIHYSDDMVYQIKLPILSLNPPAETRLERIIVGRNAVIDCTGLDVETLVCMNLLSYGDTIQKARSIRRLILLTEMNSVRDADPELGDMVSPMPLPNGLHTLFFPESQEFEYNHYAIQKSSLQFVGIIPSAYYPSRMSVGVQKTWQPIHRESLERDFVELIRG
jgi:hypothetical protein